MIRVGTGSWADESFVKVWYPRGMRSGEERLRYYAERFDTVEANSTFYRLPDEAMVARWTERLPEGFVMHVKAFGLMTRAPGEAGSGATPLRANGKLGGILMQFPPYVGLGDTPRPEEIDRETLFEGLASLRSSKGCTPALFTRMSRASRLSTAA